MTSSGKPVTILVPLDGSALAEQAIPFAGTLTGADGEIVFLQVTPDPEPVRSLLGRVVTSNEEVAKADQIRAREELVEAAGRWASALNREPRVVVTMGDPASEILRVAAERGVEMIAIASNGRGAIGRWAFGSVADRIARSSPVPVLVVRPEDAPVEIGRVPLDRIVVPHDGSAIADEALPVAATLARRVGVAVKLIHVLNPAVLVPPMPLGDPGYSGQIYVDLQDELENQAKESLEIAAATLRNEGVDVSWELLLGSPAASIEEHLHAGDLVVMTSHGRSGFRRWLMGSVAEKLVREGRAPVVLVPAAARAEAAMAGA